ncbi:MAG: hypothetical protein MR902_05165 [Campylobacter sp.]|nr:hypothetical protein [Campylobacter sp.]
MLQIGFEKISASSLPFESKVANLTFKGNLSQKDKTLYSCVGSIVGFAPYSCDRCGDEINLELNLDVNLLISDGIFKDENHEILDLMEFFDGYVDIDEILQSEVEAYKSGYFYCKKCENL